MISPMQFCSMPPYKPEDIRQKLRGLNIQVKSLTSDMLASDAYAFKNILMKDKEWTDYYTGITTDKWLEHFLSVYCLSPKPGDIMLDVASHWSPFYKIVRKVVNIDEIYIQDSCFDAGIHDNRIGSDCVNIPLPDESVDVISVNNSIEHFEGNKDSLFLKEAFRLLKPGGRLCVVPLFINSVLVNMADPDIDLSAVKFDEGAVLVSAKPWKIQFARYYTPESFAQRLVKAVPEFKYTIIDVQGMNKYDASLNYWQFVMIVQKPSSIKNLS